MNNIAIIPARSGSKGLRDKNIKKMEGRPLLEYSIDAAIQAGLFSEIMVSTDSEIYAEIARNAGASVPFLRNGETSQDRTSSWEVVREVLANYQKAGKSFETVCLLQPTSPLRKAQDIVEAYRLYCEKKANSVISVCETEHSPLWSNMLPDSLSMDGFMNEEGSAPRQQLGLYYRINGAVYIVNTEYIKQNSNIYCNSFAYIMPKERSIDIDTELDFVIAECIHKYYKSKN